MSEYDEPLKELQKRRKFALAMGKPEALERMKNEGLLNARERLDYMLDKGTFVEVGQLALGAREEHRHRTPADGKVAGFGKVDGRMVGIVSNDFATMGASSALNNLKKMKYVKDQGTKRGFPLMFVGSSSGSRMPDRMGAPGRLIIAQDPAEYRRLRKSPWGVAQLGSCYGSSTWYACMADYVVMRKGATMAVASAWAWRPEQPRST